MNTEDRLGEHDENLPKEPSLGPQSPPPSGPRMADGGKLYASCGNCSNMVESRCSLDQVPNNGELLCDLYTITPDFRDAIVDVMLGDLLKEVASTAVKVEKIRAARRFWN